MTASVSVVMVRENLERKGEERIVVGRLRMLCKTFGFAVLLKGREVKTCGRHRPAARKALGFSKGRRVTNNIVEWKLSRLGVSFGRASDVMCQTPTKTKWPVRGWTP